VARLPVIIVNVKAYEESIGLKSLELAKVCERVSKEQDVSIMIAVQATDIRMLVENVSIPVLAQHIDNFSPGAYTGFLTPEAVKDSGAYGTLLNHSEHRLRIDILSSSVKHAKSVGLFTVVCANNVEQGQAVGQFLPDLVAIEPPELIGGNISVTKADPNLVKRSVDEINEVIVSGGVKHLNRVIVGAGIKTREDVKKSIELGAVGVLVASGVVKAKDPYYELTQLALGMKK